MKHFNWILFINCDSDHEDEFNRWYDDVHIRDLLRVPGMKSVTRCEPTRDQMKPVLNDKPLICDPATIGIHFKYYTICRIETDNLLGVLNDIRTRWGTSEMEISPYLRDSTAVLCENLA